MQVFLQVRYKVRSGQLQGQVRSDTRSGQIRYKVKSDQVQGQVRSGTRSSQIRYKVRSDQVQGQVRAGQVQANYIFFFLINLICKFVVL